MQKLRSDAAETKQLVQEGLEVARDNNEGIADANRGIDTANQGIGIANQGIGDIQQGIGNVSQRLDAMSERLDMLADTNRQSKALKDEKDARELLERKTKVVEAKYAKAKSLLAAEREEARRRERELKDLKKSYALGSRGRAATSQSGNVTVKGSGREKAATGAHVLRHTDEAKGEGIENGRKNRSWLSAKGG